jgi:hypothetical protein
MRKLYSGILLSALGIFCAMPLDMNAQKGPHENSGEVRTKIVRECEYEVLPGLAEVTSIEVVRTAEESSLKYDEHEVLFKFTPMEGGEILEMLRDEEIEFVLRSRAVRVPVGPEYIKAKHLRVGTKYAMDLLQTKNRDACLERFTYESKALENDLFEAYEHIIEYTKDAYVRQLESKERAYERRKAAQKDAAVDEVVDPTVETQEKIEDVINTEFDYGDLTEEEIANLSESEMRDLVEENLRRRIENGGVSSADYGGADLGIDEAAIRAETEARLREEHAEELAAANTTGDTESARANSNSNNNNNNAVDAIKEAKRKAKENEKKAKIEEKRKEQLAIDKKKKEDEIREKISKEVEQEIQQEIADNAEASRARVAAEAALEQENLNRRKVAQDKIKSIEREMTQRIIDETRRKDCVFGERISGTIEVVKVSKVKEADVSHLKHVEYEVLVMFRPDSFGELAKKDKKVWEANYTFTLDPTGMNANPGAGYIRKYKVFKASKYQGFAQPLTSGICNSMMLYSPDLPNDVSKIKLK